VAFLLVLAAAVLSATGVLVAAHRRGRLLTAALAGIVVVAAVWGLNLLAVATGWRDMDGFVDCRDCSAGQHVAGTVFYVGFAVGMVFLTAALAALLAARQRVKR
jgi:uncharacterized membrane protein